MLPTHADTLLLQGDADRITVAFNARVRQASEDEMLSVDVALRVPARHVGPC